jgi:hypothetical protein
MNQTENVIPVSPTEQRLTEIQKKDNGLLHTTVTGAQLKAIRESWYIVFDLMEDKHLIVQTRKHEQFYFDLNAIGYDVLQTLLHACLNDKHVIGHDLARAYAWVHTVCLEWQPAVTFDTLLLARTLRPGIRLPEYAGDALTIFYTLAGAYDFDVAFENLLQLDRFHQDIYFECVELFPFACREVVASLRLYVEEDGMIWAHPFDAIFNETTQTHDFNDLVGEKLFSVELRHLNGAMCEVHLMLARANSRVFAKESAK